MAEIVPVTLRQARAYVAAHHRHNEPPHHHRFSIGLESDGVLVGVVVASQPTARMADDGRTLEIARLTTEGDRNACSRLYGAACRAAAAMGYRRVITYTLATEPGTSLKASGFVEDARSEAHAGWDRPSRSRESDRITLWGDKKLPREAKVRWVRDL